MNTQYLALRINLILAFLVLSTPALANDWGFLINSREETIKGACMAGKPYSVMVDSISKPRHRNFLLDWDVSYSRKNLKEYLGALLILESWSNKLKVWRAKFEAPIFVSHPANLELTVSMEGGTEKHLTFEISCHGERVDTHAVEIGQVKLSHDYDFVFASFSCIAGPSGIDELTSLEIKSANLSQRLYVGENEFGFSVSQNNVCTVRFSKSLLKTFLSQATGSGPILIEDLILSRSGEIGMLKFAIPRDRVYYAR